MSARRGFLDKYHVTAVPARGVVIDCQNDKCPMTRSTGHAISPASSLCICSGSTFVTGSRETKKISSNKIPQTELPFEIIFYSRTVSVRIMGEFRFDRSILFRVKSAYLQGDSVQWRIQRGPAGPAPQSPEQNTFKLQKI